MVQQILPPRLHSVIDPHADTAINLWQHGHDHPPPSLPASRSQRVWDSAIIESTFNTLLDTASDQQSRARLLATSCPKSGAWLHVLPISSAGLRMDNDVVRVAVSLRLGLPMCRPHECYACGAAVDNLGTHGLSCRFSKGRHSRHAALNDIIKRALDSAKIPCHLEPTGLYRSDGKRPDGASVVPWKYRRVLVWDAT